MFPAASVDGIASAAATALFTIARFLKIRHGAGDSGEEQQQRCADQQQPLHAARLGAGSAGGEGGAILQDHLIEQPRHKHPLRHSFRAGIMRSGGRHRRGAWTHRCEHPRRVPRRFAEADDGAAWLWEAANPAPSPAVRR